MIRINRHTLHCLLVDFKLPKTNFSFFRQKTLLRRLIETLRIDLSIHASESYVRMYEDLNDEEMSQLIKSIGEYIKNNQISAMSFVDNRMLHALICKYFLIYELDYDESDDFRAVISDYFFKLNAELQLVCEEEMAATSYATLSIWLAHLLNHTELYLHHSWVGGHGNDYYLPSLGLSECGCIDVSHDRLYSNVRSSVERLILNECKQANLDNSERPIKILSMGPGGGLQEFIIVWKLLQMGIRSIELSLVEPDYECLLDPVSQYMREFYCRDMPEGSPLPEKYYSSNQETLYSIIRAISLLSRHISDANIQISLYSSLDNLTKDKSMNTPFDIAYAVDFDDYSPMLSNKASVDFHALAALLNPKGKAIVSAHYQLRIFEVECTEGEHGLKQADFIEFERVTPTSGDYQRIHSPDSYFKCQ